MKSALETEEPNLLVSISWRGPGRARREIQARLRALGDAAPVVTPTGQRGVVAVRTSLDPRMVVRGLRAERPRAFRATCKWVPVDLWTRADLAAMREGVDRLRDRIADGERWRMTVERRTRGGVSTPALIKALAAHVSAPVDLTHPDKILMVQVFADRAALSVLAPTEVFSIVPDGLTARGGVQRGTAGRVPGAAPPQ